MFGIGSSELVVILLVALIVLGPKSLAGIARTMGKAMGEFRRVSTDFQRTLNAEAAQEEESERKKREAATTASREASKNKARSAASDAGCEANTANASAVTDNSGPVGASEPPAGSPLADALSKTGAQANDVENASGDKATTNGAEKGNAA